MEHVPPPPAPSLDPTLVAAAAFAVTAAALCALITWSRSSPDVDVLAAERIDDDLALHTVPADGWGDEEAVATYEGGGTAGGPRGGLLEARPCRADLDDTVRRTSGLRLFTLWREGAPGGCRASGLEP